MQSPPVLEIQHNVVDSRIDERAVAALRITAAVLTLAAHYEDLLKETIFPNPKSTCDQKSLLRHQRCLCDDEAYKVLMVIWKESRFFTSEMLRRAGLERQFDGGSLNAWNMATKVSTAADLAKTNTRIRSIGFAAEAYGLVERGEEQRTKKPLQGTYLLHSFMTTLSEIHSRRISALFPFLSEMPLNSPLQPQ